MPYRNWPQENYYICQMAIAFFDQDARTDQFSHTVENFLGINIHHHGQNRLGSRQIKSFKQTLQNLVKDYPQIPIAELTDIHLMHNPLQHDVPHEFREAFKVSDTQSAGTMPSIPGLGGGSIGFFMPNIESMNKISQVGHAVTTGNLLNDSLNHEFGHVVHHYLAAPEDMDYSLDGNERVNLYYNAQKRFLSHNRMTDIAKRGLSPSTLNSAYAADSDNELFAEVFARSRAGFGPGFEAARSMESRLRSEVREKAARLRNPVISSSEKMASNSRNVYKMLRSIRSGLG